MADLLLVRSKPLNQDIKILISRHSNLCEHIKLVILLLSIVNKILSSNNFTLFDELICNVLMPHFSKTQSDSSLSKRTFTEMVDKYIFDYQNNTWGLYQMMTEEQNINKQQYSVIQFLRVLFFASLYLFGNICDTKYCETLTVKLMDIDIKILLDKIIIHHSALANIPLSILGRIMSFLSTLNTIRIETTCSTFFLAADQIRSFSSIDYHLFNRLEQYDVVLTQFFRRFSGVSVLKLPINAFANINYKLKFIHMFKNLTHVTFTIINESHLHSILVSMVTNPLQHIEDLTLSESFINLSIFECIKQFKQLSSLTFSDCQIRDTEPENSGNLWQYYDVIQTSLHGIKRLKCEWIFLENFQSDFALSLTLIRMMMTQNMEYINIDASWFELWHDHDFRYYSALKSIKFKVLKVKELHLCFPAYSDINYFSEFFCEELIPYVKSLEKLKIGEWWCDEYIAVNFKMDGTDLMAFENNFLFRIVMNNLASLRNIEFNSGYQKTIKKADNELFAPVLAIYKLCILCPDWSKYVFKRFEFFKELVCDRDDYDMDWIKTLQFLIYTTKLLVPILKQNNITYLIRVGVDCQCNNSMCVLRKSAEIFPLTWQFNGGIMYLSNRTPDCMRNQSLITDYLKRM
eukprot:16442_1